jgi:hypothetical protein
MIQCKFETMESKSEVKKSKFKVEIVQDESNPSTLRIQLIHDQGSFTVFSNLVQQIQKSWEHVA